jgi:hypothetical protein
MSTHFRSYSSINQAFLFAKYNREAIAKGLIIIQLNDNSVKCDYGQHSYRSMSGSAVAFISLSVV